MRMAAPKGMIRHSEVWTLDNFSEHVRCEDEEEKSFNFPVQQDKNLSIYWTMNMMGNGCIHLEISYHLEQNGHDVIWPFTEGKVRFKLLNLEGKVVASSCDLEVASNSWDSLMTQDYITKLGILVNDQVTIVCDVTYIIPDPQPQVQVPFIWGQPVEEESKKKKIPDKAKRPQQPRICSLIHRVKTKKVLHQPAIKLECEANLTKPSALELNAWPLLRLDGRPGSSPYSIPHSFRTAYNQPHVDRKENHSTIIARKEEKQNPAPKRKKKGFCEICNYDYSDLEKHLATTEHKQLLSEQDWAEVDQFCIDNFSPSLLTDTNVTTLYTQE